MTIELWALLGTTFILWLAIFTQQVNIDKNSGAKYALSNREQGHEFEGATKTTARLSRNVRNHVEGLAMFAPLVLIAGVAGVSNSFTQYAAVALLAFRFLHFVFYSFGITPLRSIVWGLGFFVAQGAFLWGLLATVSFPMLL